jgi:hypothetical protein
VALALNLNPLAKAQRHPTQKQQSLAQANEEGEGQPNGGGEAERKGEGEGVKGMNYTKGSLIGSGAYGSVYMGLSET